MWNWVVIVGCYAFGAGFFRLIGGVGAAGEAMRRWGASESVRRADRVSAFQRALRR
jgi:hypothetical protein